MVYFQSFFEKIYSLFWSLVRDVEGVTSTIIFQTVLPDWDADLWHADKALLGLDLEDFPLEEDLSSLWFLSEKLIARIELTDHSANKLKIGF